MPLIIAFLIFVLASPAWAAPAPNGASGTLSHGGSVVITGTGFLSKSPAAPLWWDNGEGATVDNNGYLKSGDIGGVISTLGAGLKHYSDAAPTTQTYAKTDAYMQYRTAGTFRSVAAPHARSTKFMSGAHYQYCLSADDEIDCAGVNNPPYINGTQTRYDNVALTVDSGAADKDVWFVNFYYRLDPDWSTGNGGALNHKWNVFQTGATMYDGPGAGYYQSYASEDAPEVEAGNGVEISAGNNDNCGTCSGGSCWMSSNSNPRLDWVSMQVLTQRGAGATRVVRANNTVAFSPEGLGDVCAEDWVVATRSFTVGGYWRDGTDNLDMTTWRGGRNNYRYFDDLYVDNTTSRVMLCNNATYAEATICEPQIPSAWAAGEITVAMNLGKITDGATAYLFVFDSTNTPNASGYEVVLGAGAVGIGTATFTGGSHTISIGGGSQSFQW